MEVCKISSLPNGCLTDSMKDIFKNAILVKSLFFLLIVFWGGYNATVVEIKSAYEYFTDIGNALFSIFSILYLLNAFFLIKFKSLGRLTYLPLVLLFVFLGFMSEVFNPMQINRDYFYLIIFYIVSPIFFIMQGVVLSLLFSKSVQESFN